MENSTKTTARIMELEELKPNLSSMKNAEAGHEGSYLRTIFNSVYDAIFIHDLDGTIIDVNDKMLEMYQVDREDAKKLSIRDDYSSPHNPLDQLPSIWRKVISGENQFFEWIARRPKDGSVFNVEVFLRRLSLTEKDVILANVRDITERRRAEEELYAEKQKFQTLSESAPFGMVVIDRDNMFKYINPKFRELFGYDLREVPTVRSWFMKTNPNPAYRHQVVSDWLSDLRALDPGEGRPHTNKVLCKDGTKKIVNFIPVQLVTGEILMTCEDITTRTLAEDEIRRRNLELAAISRRLVEVQEAERRYIARELHDEVGQVLTGLKLSLEMSVRIAGEAAKASLVEAQSLVNNLMVLIRELSLNLRPAMLDDLGLLPALLWHFERFTAQTNIRVIFKHTGLNERFPHDVETAIYRIVQEALTNVVRHAKVNEVTVRIWSDEKMLGVQVEDHGIGFHPGAPLNTGASSGLAGMRERAVFLGGQFTLETSPGAGTRLTAELPIQIKAYQQ